MNGVNLLHKLQKPLLLLIVVVMAGCQSQPVVDDQPVKRAIDEILEQASSAPDQSTKVREQQAVADILMSDNASARRVSPITVDKFDISVANIDAGEFFFGLVSGTEYNIVVHPEVSGQLSLNLKSVSVDDVLKVVRDVYGYEFRRRGNIYTVFPRKLRTEVFKIDYLDVQRVGVSDTSVLIGQIASNNGNNNNNQNNNGGGGNNNNNQNPNLLSLTEENTNGNSGANAITPGARIQTLNATNFWEGLRETIMAMVDGDQGERMVVVNPQAGLVVVKAMPAELNNVREFLEKSELSVQRQVILETKILEVQLNDSFEAGINWGEISGALSLVTDSSSSGSIDDVFKDGATTEHLFSSVINVGDITRLLSLLETQGEVQVLSSPRVSTVNNQKALIRVGNDEFFVTGISNNTVANAAATVTTPNVELSSFFSGIALDVTPQIADDGDVILHIHPVVSEVTDQLKNFTVGDSDFSIPLALRQIRESDSIVRAENGQVVVLGGLMQEQTNNLKGKRPGLGDIPIVNSLFKTRAEGTSKTELVILMRPMVVESDDTTWRDAIESSQQRIQLFKP